MTAQFSDIIFYRDKEFAIAGKNGTGLFDPLEHGMKPVARCSACWRGYLANYCVTDQSLKLKKLQIALASSATALFGIEPKTYEGKIRIFDVIYENVNYEVLYSGGMLLARDFIKELYVHMGFHPAWKYREVHELIFENGKLIREANRSMEIEKLRQEIVDRPLKPGVETDRIEIKRWIEKCFSQDYRC